MRLLTLFAFALQCALLSAQIPEDGFTCGANEQPALLDRFANEPGALQRAQAAEAELEEFTQGFSRAGARNNYVIPVVFHIIHDEGIENISDAQIIDAVRVLNEDFNGQNPNSVNVHPDFADLVANVGVEFQLARRDPQGNCTNGITRTSSYLTYSGDWEMIQLIQWPRDRYMNVWVAASANGAAGYTNYPANLDDWPQGDGIVILHDYTGSIGTSTPYRSHVLTHEVGHWLNLRHCWGNSNEPGSEENCAMDDNVADTPNTKGWTNCIINGSSCGSIRDNVENYMEYSYCYKMFTHGQADRMLAALNSGVADRNQLWTEENMEQTGIAEEPVLCAARFDHGRTEICLGGSIQFTDMSFHAVQDRLWSFPGGEPSTSTDPAPLVTYSTPGTYSVTLQVSDGANTMTEVKTDLVHVYPDPGLPVPFSEGFEEITTFPTNGWWTVDHDGNNAFSVTNSAAYSGSRSLMLQNSSGMAGEMDELRSPPLNLEGATGLSMSFRYAYAQRNADDDDRLRVHFSIDCGVNWSIRKNLRGNQALNTAGIQTGDFFPAGEEDWELAVIDIPISTFYVSDLLMRFEFLSDGGNNLFIDDINIHGTPVGIQDATGAPIDALLLPNPAADHAELIIDGDHSEHLRIVLRDVLGRELIVILNGSASAGEQRYQIPLGTLASGTYFISIDGERGHRNVKLVKQ